MRDSATGHIRQNVCLRRELISDRKIARFGFEKQYRTGQASVQHGGFGGYVGRPTLARETGSSGIATTKARIDEAICARAADERNAGHELWGVTRIWPEPPCDWPRRRLRRIRYGGPGGSR